MSKKYYRAKEIQEAYGINPSTLSRQRWGQYGLPYCVVGRKPGKKTGGIILYNIEMNKKVRLRYYVHEQQMS